MSKKSRMLAMVGLIIGAAVAVTACSGAGPATPAADQLPEGSETVGLDPGDFTTSIDNPYWPMKPGTRWTYRESDGTGTELSVVVTITTETKEIANGITARGVRDTVRRGGEIVEDTFDWYAQDERGTVWYLGEDTAEFENGAVTSTAGSFEAGIDGALPGIAMPADPRPGMTYRQEYYRGEAEDNGEVLGVDEMADVPFGHFDGLVLTKDTSTIEPDVLQYKLYARGVGPVLVLDVSGGAGREELVGVESVPDGAGTGPLGRPE